MKFHLYRDKNRDWRWRLVSSNGRKLANSGEGYKRKSTMLSIMRKIFVGKRDYLTYRIEE